MIEIPDLQPLFLPRSLAVYGASTRDPSRLGNRLLRNAMHSALEDIRAISPTAGAAEGLQTSGALGGPVDLALISVPAASVEAAMTDAAAGGARAAIVLTSGFGETGEPGRAAQERLRAIAAKAGMRLLGPNCMGVISRMGDRGWMNGSYFWDVDLAPGGVTMLSQSGAVGGMFLAEMSRRGLGVCRFASLGNAAGLDETQILRWLAQDGDTQVIGLFAEALSGGRDFVTTVRSISAERPVVVLKAGKTATGARAAISHTGSIAGTHGAASAALRRAGAMEAQTTDEFFDLLALAASSMQPPSGSRLAVLTVSGGPSVLAADEAERLGLVLPRLSDSTLEALLAVVPSFAATRNPVDLTPQCRPEAYGPAVAAVYDDPNIEGVVVIDCGLDVAELANAVAEARDRTGKPTVAFIADAPIVAGKLTTAGVPLLSSPERAVRAYASLARRPSGGPSTSAPAPSPTGTGPPEPQALTALSEWESKHRLRGLPLVPERLTTTPTEATRAVRELQAPLVAKASGVAHKSERGLVRLRLSAEEVLDTWQKLADAGDGTVLIAEFIHGELELMIGGIRDPHLGPAVTIGLGGTAAEIFKDTVTVLAPPEPGEVESAVGALRGAPLLHGHRGAEPVDLHALEAVVRAVADALDEHDDIVEVDCNPVIISSGAPRVADALVIVCSLPGDVTASR